MKRHFYKNLILFFIAIGLTFLVFVQLKHEESLRPQPLTNIDLDTMYKLTIHCTGCNTRHFEKRQGQWWMREPYALPADASAIARLLVITQAPARFMPTSGLDPQKLGLNPAQATLDIEILSMKQLKALHFEIGITDAIDNQRYVRFDDRIALIHDRFSAFLFATAESALDRHLISPTSAITAVHINGVENDKLISTWQSIQAQHIVVPELDIFTPTDAISVVLSTDNDEKTEYRLFRHQQTYIARRSTPALDYMLNEADMQSLLGK